MTVGTQRAGCRKKADVRIKWKTYAAIAHVWNNHRRNFKKKVKHYANDEKPTKVNYVIK